MKGIILAGGKGSRLYPTTLGSCKQLLPIYDKPMIYYPLSTLLYAGIGEILLISTPEDLPRFQRLLEDGSRWGISISYEVQPRPEGIAQALLIGEKFIGNSSVALILGDNIFYGQQLPQILQKSAQLQKGALIFGYEVRDPGRYGVIEFDSLGKVVSLVEKPVIPPSPYAITGLYFYDSQVVDIVRSLKPSARGELEITDVSGAYLQRGELQVHLLERGFAWLDTGTHEALHQASVYVHTLQERQGIKVACLEEIAFQMGFISFTQLKNLAKNASSSEYGEYLEKIGKNFCILREGS